MKKHLSFLLILFAVGFIWSCKDEEGPEPQISTNQKIYEFMKYWYLWNDELPDNVDPDAYSSASAFMDAVVFKPLDKWSFVTSWESFDQYFNQGTMLGFGMGLKLDAQDQLRISYTYESSPAGEAGLSRGDKISSLNGESVEKLLLEGRLNAVLGAGQTVRFEGEKLDGQRFNHTLSKDNVTINTVLYQDVILDGDYRIGYLVFNNFIKRSYQDLVVVFDEFKAQGVNEVVLDLRYNGGGTLGATDTLASLLRKTTTENELFLEITYNEDRSENNDPIYFKPLDNATEITRLHVITTGSSASASEAIINGLRPYMPVTTIGSTTSGKPVGQSIQQIDGLAVAPIVFSVDNKEGKAEYFDGIPADISSVDDLDAPWGSLEEDCLAAAIATIKGEPARRKFAEDETRTLPMQGFRAEIGAW